MDSEAPDVDRIDLDVSAIEIYTSQRIAGVTRQIAKVIIIVLTPVIRRISKSTNLHFTIIGFLALFCAFPRGLGP